MYEPITVEIDRDYGEGTYRSHTINFTGRLVQLIEVGYTKKGYTKKGYTTMRLYEWSDRGYLVYLVHVEEAKPGQRPRRTLYPFINTHSARATPTKGYTAEDVSRAYPEFAKGKFLWLGSNKHGTSGNSSASFGFGQELEYVESLREGKGGIPS